MKRINTATRPRTYQLLIEVPAPLCIGVGRLGTFDFPAGLYVYTGSALQNFEARVRRHLSTTKKMHWHIDYLLAAPGVRVREVLRHATPECVVNQGITAAMPVPGFGASDCRACCGSHLKWLGADVGALLRAYQPKNLIQYREHGEKNNGHRDLHRNDNPPNG